MKKVIYITMAFAISLIAIVLFYKNAMSDHDIEVAIHETDEELTFSASFPAKDSERVHEYVQTTLNMSNLPDLRNVEVNKYQTPDDMRFQIESKSGYIKIVLDKTKNHPHAWQKIRDTAQGVERLLTRG